MQSALEAMFPVGTYKERAHTILVDYAKACYSVRISANLLSLSNNNTISTEWNDQNYFIEYMGNPRKQDKDHVRLVLLLFDGYTDKLIIIKSNILGASSFPKSLGSSVNYPRWASFDKTCEEEK